MQRKPGFPVANCSIKMPDSMPALDAIPHEDEREQIQKRQQIINFGHSQWGFNNWSWSVTKQELDFVDFSNGKYCAGVVAFVSVTVKNFEIHRENIGYATSLAPNKGSAIYKSRKCAVTNALRETLLSFGGSVATELMELLESTKSEIVIPPSIPPPEQLPENNQNIPNKPVEPKNSPHKNLRKDSVDNTIPANVIRSPHPVKNAVVSNPPPPPVAKAHPIPVNVAPANRPPLPANVPRPPAPPVPTPHVRPNSNELKLESTSEEEARAERKRRQRLAQEEFRLKQMMKKPTGNDDKADLQKTSGSFDGLLMNIQTQDIEIEETGDGAEGGKRRSPAPEGSSKRRSVMSKLNIDFLLVPTSRNLTKQNNRAPFSRDTSTGSMTAYLAGDKSSKSIRSFLTLS